MEEQIQIQQEQPKSHGGKIILIGAGIIGLGSLGFWAWNKYGKKQENVEEDKADSYDAPPPKSSPPSPKKNPPASKGNVNFPIKRGSKGGHVKAVQQVLAKKGLLDIADIIGEYGPKTQAALAKAGFPSIIDELFFHKITGTQPVKTKTETNSTTNTTTTPVQPTTETTATPPEPIDATKLASGLHLAAVARNFNAVITLLNQIKTTADYTSVSEKFKTYLLRGVRQTIVTGILGTFSDAKQKDAIRKAFLNMGLKYDGKKFSLSGLPNRRMITRKATRVFDESMNGIEVPQNMILGTEAGVKHRFAQFKNRGRLFFVPTTHINYL